MIFVVVVVVVYFLEKKKSTKQIKDRAILKERNESVFLHSLAPVKTRKLGTTFQGSQICSLSISFQQYSFFTHFTISSQKVYGSWWSEVGVSEGKGESLKRPLSPGR